MPLNSSPTRPAERLNLPNPRHVKRVPPHIGREQLDRIRRAAYSLPQVVKPADFVDEQSDGFEDHLDHLGLVLLQKAAAGARPSRWIAPDLMDSALAHLDAVGSGPDARPLMLERTSALQALGVARHAGPLEYLRAAHSGMSPSGGRAGSWTRLISHALSLSEAGGSVPVLFRTPVDAAAVWAFFRTGDMAALRAALGAPAPYPHAAELTAHLESLVARSRAYKPRHLDSLLPRLQSACATPQPLAELKLACIRAQDRWEHVVGEIDMLEGLNSELAFQRYPDTFDKARRLQRSVTLYVGPPNSGKTHAAFERLAQALDGAYLAPLRLLALEGRDRLVARGVPCSLLTGEENVPAPEARVVSSTIEMVGTNTPIDVAVIDEAQMIFDASRGWAWTQAIVAVPANELIIICSDYAVPAIEKLLTLCGERCEVRHFDRKQHVERLARPVPVSALQLGDAVVAFSRRDVLMLRDQIAASGHPVSVIYGALPPEVRRREAERFATGESHILVATDAIGMGLNLPIQRVLFSTMTKFDGQDDRPLSESEVHQIAGRAGRFGMHEEGFAGVLKEAEPSAAGMLAELLAKKPQAPLDFKAPVAPNGWHIDTIASRLHKTRLRDVLAVFVGQLKLDDAHFAVAELEQMLELAEALDRSAASLTLKERFIYAQAPVDTRTESQLQAFLDWSSSHALTGRAGSPWFLDEVDGHSRLDRMEQALRACTLWLWLDLRFTGVYGHVDAVLALRSELNDGIERQLKGKRPLAQVRRGMRRAGPRPAA
ncbi:helicase-related protein [Piscinibacter sp.]|uniref:helicase-related protein n=1 Tax=Piscinibacter sp. TaxID=1903157 RepID=UPI002CBAE582|nr:helicase-related protein [Albitalea sp.]HUG23513.1 helicase-related protein [Albitalea sp.]